MENRTGRVLKADTVKIKGTYRLDINRPAGRMPNAGNTVSAAPQVRIVEKNDDFAVVELMCSCGTRTCVRCEYSNTK